MIIDIDIKIANSKGKLIHTFSKRFNEKLDLSEAIENEKGISKDFEDFLNEYLTESGRAVRKKLITPMYENSQKKQAIKEKDDLWWDDRSDKISDSEMEYRIRIGKNKVIAGKIPFQRLNRLNSVTDVLDTVEDEQLGIYDRSDIEEGDRYKDLSLGAIPSDYGKRDISAEFVRNLENLMIQAVKKYESSFYLTDGEMVEYEHNNS